MIQPNFIRSSLILILASSITACQPSGEINPDIEVTLAIQSTEQFVSVPHNSTVQDVIEIAGISLEPLDRTEPSRFSIVTEGSIVRIIHVSEEFEINILEIPFERQEFPNESMPEGEIRLVQAGKNGIVEITTRNLFEDGLEISESIVSETIIESSIPEIIMVGVQTPFSGTSIPGRLVYLTAGNAWLIESSTSNRRPIITTGDLDGRVFSLSHDGKLLLFSRKSNRPADEEINSLWVVNLLIPSSDPIDLHITNVIHFAGWQPGKEYVVTYSTVEPRSSAPGWQANNDLFLMEYDIDEKRPGEPEQILYSSSGGVYGWWGTTFAWSPDGTQLAYSRPDSIGLVDFSSKTTYSLVEIMPYNTFSDWAWIPGITWSPDSSTIYYTSHPSEISFSNPEESPIFDLSSITSTGSGNVSLSQDIGMFSYPLASPLVFDESLSFDIAYLTAVSPFQSATSRYRIYRMDQDGSEPTEMFPQDTSIGLQPQKSWGAWSSDPKTRKLALIFEGNLWLLEVVSGGSIQVTGDGLTTTLDWK